MKILLLNDYATPSGGAEILSYDLRNNLRKRGHEVKLLSSSIGTASGENFSDCQFQGTTTSARTLLQTGNPWAAAKLAKVLGEFKPDVVHASLFLTQLSPLILPLLRDFPSMYYAVWHRAICPTGLKLLPDDSDCHYKFGAACLKTGCLPIHDWIPLMLQMTAWMRWRSSFNLIAAGSNSLREQLESHGISPVQVLWHGVPIRPARPPLTDPPTACFAGRLRHEKGAHVLVQAFAQALEAIPNANLIIAGNGPEEENIKQLSRQLGVSDHIKFTGQLDRSTLERELQCAWVQVVPSKCREAFGLVAAESMMRGTAVIASNFGGLPEFVTHEQNGLLVPPKDIKALTQALITVLTNRQLAEQMGSRARQFALDNLSDHIYTDKLLVMLNSIAAIPTKSESYSSR